VETDPHQQELYCKNRQSKRKIVQAWSSKINSRVRVWEHKVAKSRDKAWHDEEENHPKTMAGNGSIKPILITVGEEKSS
jgi:hypothetical protein